MAGPRETRVFAEGSLRWVQASGTGGWVTASAPQSALMGFVQAGLTFQSANNAITIMERGIPSHHKEIGKAPPTITFTYFHAVTANIPSRTVNTASGVTVKAAHFELKMNAVESANAAAEYYQFVHGVIMTEGFTEAENGNNYQETWQFLSMLGPTASGYLG